MSPDDLGSRERTLELLAERATLGLGVAEQAELASLLGEHGDLDDGLGLDLAAAAVDLSLTVPAREMPPALRARLERDAEAFFAGGRGRSVPGLSNPGLSAARAGNPRPRRAPPPVANATGPSIARRAAPWLVAAAALVLAVVGWWPAPPVSDGVPGTGAVTEGLDAAALRLATAPGTRVLSWSTSDDPAAAGASGAVIWRGDGASSEGSSEGYLRIAGLAANDPAVSQYQLWIFDASRDPRYPVDGGVFDIPAGRGEVVVPIRAKLPVDEATLFAVTVEPPGGVVVSDRERIVLTAAVS